MQATRPADVNRMIELIQSRIHAILGTNLSGLYLSGSLVTGDFDSEVSDIDLVAVTASDLTGGELERLEAMHRDIALQERKWDNRIEVAYLSAEALRTFRTRTSTIAITSPGEPFHTKVAGNDWLPNWYVVREKGSTLYGPSPQTFIDPISVPELIQWVTDDAEAWRAWKAEILPRNAQVYATLTICRALHTAKTGNYVSKRQAALWAAREMPEWAALIQNALRSWREDWYNENVDHDATRFETILFVNAVIDRIVG